MKKYILFLIISLLALSACSGSSSNYITNFHTGTQGITVSFLENYPEDEMYDDVIFPVVILVENIGAVDVPKERTWISFSYDPLYFTFEHENTLTSNIDLHGKSEFYPEGEQTQLEFFDAKTNKIIGQRQRPTSAFSALVCYEYRTDFSTSVCIDVDRYLRTGREQVCQGEDIRESSQGAPVAFTLVEVNTQPVQTGVTQSIVKPSFDITVKNVGGGVVAGPPKQNLQEVCQLKNMERQELGAVYVNGSIFNIPLECTPALVPLNKGEGKTRCTIGNEHLNNAAFSRQQNIVAVLNLEAKYIYRSAHSKEITIVQRETYDSFSDNSIEENKVRGYAYGPDGEVERQEGVPLTQCRYNAINGVGGVGSNWDCVCEVNQCASRDNGAYCSFGLCPGTRECCDIEGIRANEATIREQNAYNSRRIVTTGEQEPLPSEE